MIKRYFKDMFDILTLKTCPNDYSCFYSYLLVLPITIILWIIAYLIYKRWFV